MWNSEWMNNWECVYKWMTWVRRTAAFLLKSVSSSNCPASVNRIPRDDKWLFSCVHDIIQVYTYGQCIMHTHIVSMVLSSTITYDYKWLWVSFEHVCTTPNLQNELNHYLLVTLTQSLQQLSCIQVMITYFITISSNNPLASEIHREDFAVNNNINNNNIKSCCTRNHKKNNVDITSVIKVPPWLGTWDSCGHTNHQRTELQSMKQWNT